MSTIMTSPASPPHSPSRPKHFSKTSDPFFELPVTPTQFSPPPESPQQSEDAQLASPSDSLFSQLVVSPLLFTSFLLSLFLVDRNNRAYRVSQHPSDSTAVSILHHTILTSWWDPEPYSESGGDDHGATDQKKRPWYVRKKHRKVAGMEITDAFELRTRVIVAMILGMSTIVIGGALGIKKLYEWTWAG